MAFSNTYDIATPDGDVDDPAEADDRMRETKAALQERLNVEHVFDLTGTEVSGDNTGKHTNITATTVTLTGAFSGTTIAASGAVTIGGTLDVTGNIDPTTYETTNGGFLDEDDLASDAADKVASQQSIKAYVDLDSTGSVQHDAEGGFSNCDVNGTKTKVYTKYLTGTLDAAASTAVVHGISDALNKILKVGVHIFEDSTYNGYLVDAFRAVASAAVSYQCYYDGTNINIDSVGVNIQGNGYRIEIDYML